jgi:hypothetical protein
VLLYVDDIIIAGKHEAQCNEMRAGILTTFKGRDLGEAQVYLNWVFTRDWKAGTLKASQPRHIKELLERWGIGEELRPRPVPLAPGALTCAQMEGEALMENPRKYAEAVGSLMYLSNSTRPDIAFASHTLARHMAKPTERHWGQVIGVMRYLKGTMELGIVFGGSSSSNPAVPAREEHVLHGMVDSDYGSCINTRRSRAGMVFKLAGGPISWSSKMQPVVGHSTAEVEYMAASLAGRESQWLKRLCHELEVSTGLPMPLYVDNTAALHMAEASSDSVKTKHIGVAFHSLRESVTNLQLTPLYIPTEVNTADMLTKPLGEAKFVQLRKMLGMG